MDTDTGVEAAGREEGQRGGARDVMTGGEDGTEENAELGEDGRCCGRLGRRQTTTATRLQTHIDDDQPS